MITKINSSIRFSVQARQMADALAKYLGVSRSTIIEMAIRNFHQRNKPPTKTRKQ